MSPGEDVAELQSRARSAQLQVDAWENRVAAVSADIARLKAAQRKIGDIGLDLRVMELDTNHPESCVWEGDTKRKHDQWLVGVLSGDLGAYSQAAKRLHSHMSERIHELQKELNSCHDSIGSVSRAIADIQAQIESSGR